MSARGRSSYRIPWNDAVLIVGGEDKLREILGLNVTRRRSTKQRKLGRPVPIQDIGRQIHLAWKERQQVDIDSVRRESRSAGYAQAVADREAVEANVKAEIARRRARGPD